MRSRWMLTLLAALVLSTFICVLAAARRSELTMALATSLYALQVLLLLARINVPVWVDADRCGGTDWAWNNSILSTLTYFWGGLVMLTAYPFGGLVWRHWWQYGAGMMLLGAAALLCAWLLIGSGRPERDSAGLRTLMRLTALQAAAIVASLIYLVGSGALATMKDDWAANYVFLAGSITILIVSLVSLALYRRATIAR